MAYSKKQRNLYARKEKRKTGGEPVSVVFEMPVIQDFSNYQELQKSLKMPQGRLLNR